MPGRASVRELRVRMFQKLAGLTGWGKSANKPEETSATSSSTSTTPPRPQPDDDDDLPPPPSGGFVMPPGPQGDGDMPPVPDAGFRCLSDEELQRVLSGPGSGTAGASGSNPTLSYLSTCGDEEWDCRFTFDVNCKPPPNNPDGDPVVINDYHVKRHLGAGSFGSVKLVERQVGEPPYKEYAVKMLSKHRLRRFRQSIMSDEAGIIVKTGEDLVKSEISILRHLYHRNVVLLFEVMDDPVDDHIFLVMEYLEGGLSMVYDKDTRTFTSPITKGVLDEALASKLFFGLISGLQYLHSKRICHRDIKPENLLVTQGTKLRITDFGCARQFKEGEEELLRDTAGTFSFLAPECCSGDEFSAYPPDIWAAGVTLYCFIFGKLPFAQDAIEALFDQIQTAEPDYPEETPMSPPLRELLQACLLKDAKARWGLDRIKAHEWLEVPRREDEEDDAKAAAAEEDAAKDPEASA